MVDKTLREGRLAFNFSNVDFATKYDDWVHYRNQYNSACGGSKAVDFVVLKDGVTWLIEVKDYRSGDRTKSIDLADEVMLKVRDTMAGLVSTHFVGTRASEAEVASAAISSSQLRVCLHLEQPKKPSRLFPFCVDPVNLRIKLRRILRFADPHVEVYNSAGFPNWLGTVDSV